MHLSKKSNKRLNSLLQTVTQNKHICLLWFPTQMNYSFDRLCKIETYDSFSVHGLYRVNILIYAIYFICVKISLSCSKYVDMTKFITVLFVFMNHALIL